MNLKSYTPGSLQDGAFLISSVSSDTANTVCIVVRAIFVAWDISGLDVKLSTFCKLIYAETRTGMDSC